MNLLCMDTSGPVCGVCLLQEGQVLAELTAINQRTHSVNLLPMVEEALTRSQMDIFQVDLFAAVTGPGSFTGVRIGVSLVKGLAHGAGKPCIGVDALEALAASLYAPEGILCPIQDARAGQVYGALFSPGLPPKRLCPNQALALEEFVAQAKQHNGPYYFIGDGVPRHLGTLRTLLGEQAKFPPAHLCFLRPSAAAMLAWHHQDQQGDYLQLMPQYLRAPQAQRERERRLRGTP